MMVGQLIKLIVSAVLNTALNIYFSPGHSVILTVSTIYSLYTAHFLKSVQNHTQGTCNRSSDPDRVSTSTAARTGKLQCIHSQTKRIVWSFDN